MANRPSSLFGVKRSPVDGLHELKNKLPDKGEVKGPELLTSQQRAIVSALAYGQPIKDVAATIGVTSRTVEYHYYQIRATIGFTCVAEMVHWAIATGVVKNLFHVETTLKRTAVDNS
jgi:DNA-binding NarL/FixJ family response regulator